METIKIGRHLCMIQMKTLSFRTMLLTTKGLLRQTPISRPHLHTMCLFEQKSLSKKVPGSYSQSKLVSDQLRLFMVVIIYRYLRVFEFQDFLHNFACFIRYLINKQFPPFLSGPSQPNALLIRSSIKENSFSVNITVQDVRFSTVLINVCRSTSKEQCKNTTVPNETFSASSTVILNNLIAATTYNVSVYTVLDSGLMSFPFTMDGFTGTCNYFLGLISCMRDNNL